MFCEHCGSTEFNTENKCVYCGSYHERKKKLFNIEVDRDYDKQTVHALMVMYKKLLDNPDEYDAVYTAVRGDSPGKITVMEI